MKQLASECGRYRYLVSAKVAATGKPLGFVLDRPSNDEDPADDEAIRRCLYLARREGYGGALISYAWALRPQFWEAARSTTELIGGKTAACLHKIAKACDQVVLAYGDLVDSQRVGGVCLGLNGGTLDPADTRLTCLPLTRHKNPLRVTEVGKHVELWPFPPVFLHHPESNSVFVASHKQWVSDYSQGTGACERIHYERYLELVEDSHTEVGDG